MQHNLQLNNSYQYVQRTPAPDRGNRISLSLSDLVSSDYSIRKPEQPQNETSSEYKQELATLLAKSRGTSYERTLKKFVETKYREIQADEEAKAQDSRLMRTSLASLSSSKYDSPNRASVFDDSVLNERKSRLDEMSKPMDRQIWKGPVLDVPRVSTNLIGRQRPSPLKARPYELSSSNSNISINALSTPRSVRDRSPSPAGRGGETTDFQKRSASVSVQEFNKWLQTNRDWKKRHDEKVARTIEQDNRAAKEQARPKILTKSLKLGEVANAKETVRLFQRGGSSMQDQLSLSQSFDEGDGEEKSISDQLPLKTVQRAESPSVYDRLGERGRQFAKERMSWEPPSDQQSHVPVILERSRRLSRGRELRRTNSTSRLTDRSTSRERDSRDRMLARSRDTTDINPATLTNKTFLRGSGISKVTAVPESEQFHYNSSLSVGGQSGGGGGQVSLRLTDLLRTRSGSEVSTGPISNRMYNQSSSSQLNASRQGRSRSVNRNRAVESLNVTALAVSGIEKMRSVSATRQREKTELANKHNYLRPDTAVTPFTPTLVATETQRIMSRVTTTFEERTLKAVDTLFVNRHVAKRVASPGPGYYPNAHTVAVSPHKTMREARASSVRSVSPAPVHTAVSAAVIAATVLDRASLLGSPLVGSKGYSFGKEALGRFSYVGSNSDTSLMTGKR